MTLVAINLFFFKFSPSMYCLFRDLYNYNQIIMILFCLVTFTPCVYKKYLCTVIIVHLLSLLHATFQFVNILTMIRLPSHWWMFGFFLIWACYKQCIWRRSVHALSGLIRQVSSAPWLWDFTLLCTLSPSSCLSGLVCVANSRRQEWWGGTSKMWF